MIMMTMDLKGGASGVKVDDDELLRRLRRPRGNEEKDEREELLRRFDSLR